jgi:hypothetical protein
MLSSFVLTALLLLGRCPTNCQPAADSVSRQSGVGIGALAHAVEGRSSVIAPTSELVRQPDKDGPVVLGPPTGTAAGGAERVKHVVGLFLGLWRLALLILICSAGVGLLLLGRAYRKQEARGDVTAFAAFVRASFATYQWWWCLLLVTDVFILSNHLLVRGLAFGLWDVDNAYYPYQALVADFARAGRLVQWDPWSNGGFPMGSDPQVGAYSPVSVLLGLLTGSGLAAFTFYWLLMWWLGGVGVLLLARQLRAPAWGAGAVALGFLFCGFYTGHAEHTSSVLAFSALPLVIWRLEVALSSQRLQPALEAGALWGLSALSGYPAQTILTGCYAALWAVGHWLCATSPNEAGTTRKPTLRMVCCALALLAAVGGVVLLPSYFAFFYDGAGTHTRVGALSREDALLSDTFTPGVLATFASPFLPTLKLIYWARGVPVWPKLDVSMCSIYAGALVTVLAAFALVNRPRERWRWWLLGLGLFSLACTFGETLPLRGWLYDWFYPTRFFRHPALFRAYYLFTLVPLALLAARDLAEAWWKKDERVWARLFGVAVLVAGGALLAFLALIRSLPPVEIQLAAKAIGYSHTLGVWLGVCALALLAWRWMPRFKQRWLLCLLLVLAAGDAFLTDAISLDIMVEVDGVASWQRLDGRRSKALDLTAQGLQREARSAYAPPYDFALNNDQMFTKLPVLEAYSPAQNDFHLAIVRDPLLKGMGVGSERIWFAREAAQVALTDANLTAYRSRASALGGLPLVVHAPEQMLRPKQVSRAPAEEEAQIAALPAAERVSVKLLRYMPEELNFEVQCPADGWLLVTDRWARGWRAEVNAHQVPVYGGNFIFRAVPVTAGQNRIRFAYHMFAFPWLIVLSWGTLAAVLAGALYRSAVRSRPQQTVVGNAENVMLLFLPRSGS